MSHLHFCSKARDIGEMLSRTEADVGKRKQVHLPMRIHREAQMNRVLNFNEKFILEI